MAVKSLNNLVARIDNDLDTLKTDLDAIKTDVDVLTTALGDTVAAAAANAATAAANTAVTITRAAVSGQKHTLYQVVASYSAAPTGGKLTISEGATAVFEIDLTDAGPHVITFSPPLRTAANNTTLVTTLAAGSGAVVGKLNVLTRTSA